MKRTVLCTVLGERNDVAERRQKTKKGEALLCSSLTDKSRLLLFSNVTDENRVFNTRKIIVSSKFILKN